MLQDPSNISALFTKIEESLVSGLKARSAPAHFMTSVVFQIGRDTVYWTLSSLANNVESMVLNSIQMNERTEI